MWKKNEPEYQPQSQTSPPPPRPSRPSQGAATIGPSIAITGNLTGEEDLLIQGRIDGKIVLEKNSITVGKEGRIKADIHGRTIQVEGKVEGDLYGREEVVIRASGRVEGNLIAPRVTLEDGSRFKGSIDMESRKKAPVPAPTPKTAMQPSSPDSSEPKSSKEVSAEAAAKPTHSQQTLQGSATRP